MLLYSVACGSKEAFEVMFSEYYPKVKNLLCGMLKDEFMAENISQDLFMNLWINREQLKDIKSIDDYLFICTRNATMRELRADRRKVPYSEMYVGDLSENKTEHDVLMTELRALLQSEIDKMPPQRRTVFEMSRLEGLSTAEISERLGISPRTVERHISMALASLRKIEYIVLLLVFSAR